MKFRLVRRVVDQYREWLTPRGRYLFWLTAALAVLGLNTKGTQVFKLFAVTAAMLAVASLFAAWRAPRVELSCALPHRLTAGAPLELPLRLATRASSFLRPLLVSFPRGFGVAAEPRQSLVVASSEEPIRTRVSLRADRRGRYVVRGPTVRATDPLGLVGSRALRLPEQMVVVYPRFYRMESFRLPLGRRHQPGRHPSRVEDGG